MKPDLSTVGVEQFLDRYWQREPVIIRQAFPDFSPELDSNDVAGLACEAMVESRLVSGTFPAHDWQLAYGPFAESTLENLPNNNWTLLVQDVEKHYPPLKVLLDGFDFIPSWRLDDLMISVAAPGGSVGPHVDQYDVFLLQAAGRRQWQIAREFNPKLLSDCELNVLESFEAEQEWVLEPGDMLYLPPGVAHHGIAIDTGMTWSIGLRAPSAADILQSLGEWLATEHAEGPRYQDHEIRPSDRHKLDTASLTAFRDLLGSVLEDKRFEAFLGDFISDYRMAHRPAPAPESMNAAAIHQALGDGKRLRHNPWTRLLWTEQADPPGTALLHARGDQFTCRVSQAELVCDAAKLNALTDAFDHGLTDLLAQLLDKGHLYFEAL